MIIQIILFALLGFIFYKLATFLFGEVFSSTKRCTRCEGKGWWQNTRNRETCEWCKGSGRLPKDFPM